ncbi:glycine zipper domain-containing protein [Ramlibacter sp.]|uniref:glycine zipper domain-containing protein n=1 Tax=Ramlibacter sp. TaxID=1917967 RepID=UPI003D12BC73
MNEEKKKDAGTGVGIVAGAAAGGVAGGAAAGAAVGGMTGPVGAAVGAAVGAVAGAVLGRKAADPVIEDKYWRDNYASRPYAQKDVTFDHYSPAYRAGVESYSRNPGRSWDDVEPELKRDWASTRGTSSLEWDRARPAARDAWDRVSNAVERAIPGDSDKDGR